MPRKPKIHRPIHTGPGADALNALAELEQYSGFYDLHETLLDAIPNLKQEQDVLKTLPTFRQMIRHIPRANKTLTLSLPTIETLEYVSRMTDMNTGKALDWLLSGVNDQVRKILDRRRREWQEKRQMEEENARIEREVAGVADDGEDEEDDDDSD